MKILIFGKPKKGKVKAIKEEPKLVIDELSAYWETFRKKYEKK